MSWSGDSDNHSSFKMGPTQKWKTQMTKVEQAFNKVTQISDSVKRKFHIMKTNHSDLKNLETEIESLNNFIRQLSNEIDELDKLVMQSNDQELNARKCIIKDLRKRAADQTKVVRELCTDINSELRDRQMMRKREISVTSHELGFDEESMKHNEQMIIDDSQIRIALEEQRQMDKITKEVIQLENMFVKLNNMVIEQGEMVDHIVVNVEDAYENVNHAEAELGKAVTYKRSAFKKKICIIGIVIAILAVIALIIGLSVGIKKS